MHRSLRLLLSVTHVPKDERDFYLKNRDATADAFMIYMRNRKALREPPGLPESTPWPQSDARQDIVAAAGVLVGLWIFFDKAKAVLGDWDNKLLESICRTTVQAIQNCSDENREAFLALTLPIWKAMDTDLVPKAYPSQEAAANALQDLRETLPPDVLLLRPEKRRPKNKPPEPPRG